METYTKEQIIGGIPKVHTYTNRSFLHNWEENPREIKTEMFDFLIESLHEEGQLMPMLVDVRPERMGTILGGNMTFRAWTQNLNREEVWIEPFLPRDDNHAIQVALKHNANYGQYIELKLQELAQRLQEAGYDLASIPVPPVPDINLEQILARVSNINGVNQTDEWMGMPDFESANSPFKIVVNFENETDRDDFLNKTQLRIQNRSKNAWSTWYPFKEKEDKSSLKYENIAEPIPETNEQPN